MTGKLKHIIVFEKILNQRVKRVNFIYKNLITVVIILLGILIFISAESLLKHTYNLISQFYFYYFTLQAIMIANRGMNYLIVYSDKYFLFPVQKQEIFFFNIVSLIWDRNAILTILLVPAAVIININSKILVTLILIVISILCTLCYYLAISTIITFLPRHIKESRQIYIVHFLILIYVEAITRISQANYLWDMYPFSGWVGSTVIAAYHENYIQVMTYLIGIVGLIVLACFISIRFMYPKGKYA